MHPVKIITAILIVLATTTCIAEKKDYQRSKFDPIHFPPLINSAKDEQCLSCHAEVTQPSTKQTSPAGFPASEAKAFYQYLSTYEGKQETFHRRHLSTPYANSVMKMQCTTCHQGNEPRDEMAGTPPINNEGFTLRKMVDPKICQQCHGQLDWKIMGLPSPWHESKTAFANNCLTCHAAIRTNRHQVNYLKADEIEKLAAEKGGDVCYGCHGGRPWYRTSFPYPRHTWPGMSPAIPEWAKGRSAESPERFQIKK